MLKKLIQCSIDHAGLVLLASGVLVALAFLRIPHTPVDVFPELNAPTVVIMAESPGLAADEVEQFVTFPIETAVSSTSGIRRVRTTSAMGLSITWVEFDWDIDIYRARQLVSERLAVVRERLPRGVHAELTPISSITGEIMLLALSSPSKVWGPLELRSYAEFDLRNQLLAVPGVAQVAVIGGELPEYQIVADQEMLTLYGLSMMDLAQAADASHSAMTAGYLPNVRGLELPVRQSGNVRSLSDIERTVIQFHQGRPITIGDVADVRIAGAPKRGTGADGGAPAIVLTVQKSPNTNTLEVTNRIDIALDAIDSALPNGVVLNRQIFRQSDLINRSVWSVLDALRDAAVIVALILMLFLLNIRTTLIALAALPLSLAVTLLSLDWIGESINVMTLGGLAIAVGSLVDDAIIDVENVYRRIGQNAQLPADQRKSIRAVIFMASNEIRPSMVLATGIIVLAVLPLMFFEGVEGRFFQPLGMAFMISIASSLLVALTVTPALCRLLFHDAGHGKRMGDGLLVRQLKRIYDPVLRWAICQSKFVLFAAAVMTCLSLWLGSTFGSAFLPEFREGTFTVGLFASPGTSLDASHRMASSVEQQIMEVDGVRTVTRRTGRAERDEHAEPVSNSEIEVTVLSDANDFEVRSKIRSILENVPGITSHIGQPIQHRLSHILSGTPAAIAINIYGDDLGVLRQLAKSVAFQVEAIPGAVDVAAHREVLIESIPIQYQLDVLASYGLTPQSAAEQVRAAVHGIMADQVHDGSRRLDMVVRLDESYRSSINGLRRIILHGEDGAMVRLEDVAVIGPELTSHLIARENMRRKAVVSLNVASGFNLGDLVSDVQRVVDPMIQEAGCTVQYGGQFESQQSAARSILVYGGIALVVMFGLLHIAVGSSRVAMLVMLNLPLALIGGVLAIFISESPSPLANLIGLFGAGRYVAPVVSISSLVGFITLFGIAVRNGVLLVNHYQHLMSVENVDLRAAILRGSMERLSPILMTALTAALALIPIIVKGSEPGNEILAPLAVVILGGLLSSTLLNLIVIPAGFALVHSIQSSKNMNL